jgi:hypothetical protein
VSLEPSHSVYRSISSLRERMREERRRSEEERGGGERLRATEGKGREEER